MGEKKYLFLRLNLWSDEEVAILPSDDAMLMLANANPCLKVVSDYIFVSYGSEFESRKMFCFVLALLKSFSQSSKSTNV